MQVLIEESGEYLNPWFVSFPYGYVLCAHCTCIEPVRGGPTCMGEGGNEMCLHIGGLLHQVHRLKLKAEHENINTTTTIAHDSNYTYSGGASMAKEHRMGLRCVDNIDDMDNRHNNVDDETTVREVRTLSPTPFKRKKRVKLYVCGICSSQFADKKTFMNHCQLNHALPPLIHKDQRKRKHEVESRTSWNQVKRCSENDEEYYSENVVSEKPIQQEVISLDDFLINLEDDIAQSNSYETVAHEIQITPLGCPTESIQQDSISSDRPIFTKDDPDLIVIEDDEESQEPVNSGTKHF